MNRKCKSGIPGFRVATRPRSAKNTELTDAPSHDPFAAGKQEPVSAKLRLPGYDLGTRRLELGAFCVVGLTAVALVLLAGVDAARFSQNRDHIAAALSSKGILLSTSSGAATNRTLTNLTAIPAQSRERTAGPTHPDSDPS